MMANGNLTTRGRAWRLGDLVNIDQICATRYLTKTVEVWAEQTFEELIPNFREQAKQGDIVVAGQGFAYGMGHDHPILGLRACGIYGVVAESFGPQFYRAAIAHGMPLMESRDLGDVTDGVLVSADFTTGTLTFDETGDVVTCTPLDGTALEIVRAGNLASFLRNELASA